MRNIYSFVFIVFLSLFFAGCNAMVGYTEEPITRKGYEQKLRTWKGHTEAELIRSWGVPQKVYKSGGSKFLVYTSARNVYIPGTAPSYTTTFWGYTAHTTGYGGEAPRNINFYCQTTFEIINDKIVGISYKGNDCKALESKSTATVTESQATSTTTESRYKYTYKAYTDRMRYIASQIKYDKKYTKLSLNTKEEKEWFKALTYKLWSGKIDKKTFIREGLKRHPTHEYEFKFIANKLSTT